MNLLLKKDDLLNQIFLITKEALSFLSDDAFDDYEKINSIFEKRQSIINEINVIDEQIKNSKDAYDKDEDTKKSIEITLNGIASLDEKIDEIVQKQFSSLSTDIKNIKEGRKGLDIGRDEEVKGVNLDVSQ